MSVSTEQSIEYGDEREELERLLSGADRSPPDPIAVLSEPFGGREQLLDHAETCFEERATRIRCSPTAGGDRELDLAGTDVLLVDDCQHRFVRRIGGFDGFDRFLRQIATFDGTVITSWNTFSWDYLAGVKDLGLTFPTQIRLGALGSEEIQALLLDEYEGEVPEMVDDRDVTSEPLLQRRSYPLSVGRDRTVDLPYLRPNVDELVRRTTERDGDTTETLVFERLTQHASGNPGVARYLWEEGVSDGRLALSEIREPAAALGLDYDTAFLLQVLLTKERIPYDELADVVEHPDIDRALGQLAKKDVLTVEDDLVVLRPGALKPLVESLERRRIIW